MVSYLTPHHSQNEEKYEKFLHHFSSHLTIRMKENEWKRVVRKEWEEGWIRWHSSFLLQPLLWMEWIVRMKKRGEGRPADSPSLKEIECVRNCEWLFFRHTLFRLMWFLMNIIYLSRPAVIEMVMRFCLFKVLWSITGSKSDTEIY